jgi:hypothetical protein
MSQLQASQARTDKLQVLTIVFLLQLIAGSKEFKIGFSGMNLTEAQMAGTIKVGVRTTRFWHQAYPFR